MKLNYNKPMLFYQDAKGEIENYSDSCSPRIRLVYPDGKIEWCSLDIEHFENSVFKYGLALTFSIKPCYGDQFKNSKSAIKIINEYDKSQGYKPMVLIEVIK